MRVNMEKTKEKTEKNRIRIKDMVTVALLAAVLCILCPWSVPIGPVPVSLGVLGVALVTYVAGMKRALAAVLIYLLIGFVGVPVFTGFTGGAAKLFGPTGGYLIGYLPMVFLSGLVIDRFPETKIKHRIICFFALCGGTVVLYTLGTIWLAVQGGYTLPQALSFGVLPFIPFDLIKLAIVTLLAPMIRSRLPL